MDKSMISHLPKCNSRRKVVDYRLFDRSLAYRYNFKEEDGCRSMVRSSFCRRPGDCN